MSKNVERQIKDAVECIVCDTLYFNDESPLRVATRTKRITPMILAESEGYKTLLRLLGGTDER